MSEDLHTKDRFTRFKAVTTIFQNRQKAHLSENALVELLNDETVDMVYKIYATATLAVINPDKYNISELIEILDNATLDYSLCFDIANILAELGEYAVDALPILRRIAEDKQNLRLPEAYRLRDAAKRAIDAIENTSASGN